MWEDGFCRGRVGDCLEEIDGEDPVRKAFSKMSIQLYNYGEGWVLGRCYYFDLNSHTLQTKGSLLYLVKWLESKNQKVKNICCSCVLIGFYFF